METESGTTIPFLDVLLVRKGPTRTTKVYRNPIHTGYKLSFESNHPNWPESEVVQSMCQE
jgi:hypothetical protein